MTADTMQELTITLPDHKIEYLETMSEYIAETISEIIDELVYNHFIRHFEIVSPLLNSTIDLILERHGELMKRGAVLVDENDPSETPRMLFYLEHVVQDGRRNRIGDLLTISKRLQFVEVGPDNSFRDAGSAPYLDYRPLTESEQVLIESEIDADWICRDWDAVMPIVAL